MNIRYIPIEPAAYDKILLELPGDKRKTFAVLTLHLLAKNGVVKDDVSALAELCGLTDIELQRHLQFMNGIWRRFRGRLYHNLVRKDYLNAVKRRQALVKAGLIGSEVKKHRLSDAEAMLGHEESKEVKNTSFSLKSAKIPVSFARELNEIIPARKPSDWKAYENIGFMVAGRIREGKATERSYELVKEVFREASGWKKNPVGLAFSLLKKRYGYKRTSRGGTGKLADELEEIKKRIGVQNAPDKDIRGQAG